MMGKVILKTKQKPKDYRAKWKSTFRNSKIDAQMGEMPTMLSKRGESHKTLAFRRMGRFGVANGVPVKEHSDTAVAHDRSKKMHEPPARPVILNFDEFVTAPQTSTHQVLQAEGWVRKL